MATSIEMAKRFEDLIDLQSHDMPYSFDKIFSTEGWGAKSLSKKKFKLLKEIDSQIRAMLNENEKVQFISWGVDTPLIDQFFIGWVLYYINRMAFVFTTERILLLQISTRNKPLALKGQIRYPAIAKSGHTIFGDKIEFQSGKTRVFIQVPKKDRKFMHTLIENLRSTTSTPAIDVKEKENLCPYCYVAVEGFPQSCPHCQKTFKSANKAGWLSLLFPGFGDFYLGHRFFAILEILGALWVWLILILPSVIALVPFVIIFIHVPDALVTRYIGRKGIYPSST